MADLNDISLVTQVAVFHNKKAFDQLVRKYQSPVRRFFLNQTLGDEQLSDDLAQDTFIKAYVNITKFKGLSSFSTWLFRIAYNVHYDYIRSLHQTDDIDTSAAIRQSSASGDENLKMDLYKALSLLKPDELYHPTADRRTASREDRRDHRHSCQYGEIASEERKRQNDKLFKTEWL